MDSDIHLSLADVECRSFHELNVSDVCRYINTTEDCQIDEGFISYSIFVYCDLQDLLPLGCFIVFMWWLFLFVGLATTADDFFCPSLTVISNTMHLSQNVAGVTFLAFGNGAPDIFSAIAAISSAKSGDAGLAFGALFGAGVFVTTIVAGTIAIICPFDSMKRPFLRDVIFYLAATFWAFYVLWDKVITKYEAIGFIILYLIYVLVVVLGRYIRQRKKRHEKDKDISIPDPSQPSIQDNDDLPDDAGFITQNSLDEEVAYRHMPGVYSVSGQLQPHSMPATDVPNPCCANPSIIDDSIDVQDHSGQDGDTQQLVEPSPDDDATFTYHLHQLLKAISPIDHQGWKDMKIYRKIYEIFKSPLLFMLIITIPVIDYNEAKHKWNRYLNCIHCVTGPMFCIFATKLAWKTIDNTVPVWGFVLLVSAVLAGTVFCSSKDDTQPVYHPVFAYLGFLIAVVWIYSIANEIVNILQTFGVVFNISNAILGLTLLAWGNSVGDFIADTVMARQGYPRMGISACFGGPLFNLLLGVGIPFTIQIIKSGADFKLIVSLEQYVLVAFLGFSLISSLMIVVFSKFRMSRVYGIYLWILYVIFLIVAILAETGVIKGDV